MLPDMMTTDMLTLRPFEENDAAAVYAYWQSDPGWEAYNESVPANFTEADALSFVKEMRSRGRDYRPNWAMERLGEVIGVVSISFDKTYRTAMLGYGIHASFRGRGIVVQVAGMVIDAAFAMCPSLSEVRAMIDRRNIASGRVLEKLGFGRESENEYCLTHTAWQQAQERTNDE